MIGALLGAATVAVTLIGIMVVTSYVAGRMTLDDNVQVVASASNLR
jgi:hypothetical protein